jgi:uncharacterized protein (TIGR03066 family)
MRQLASIGTVLLVFCLASADSKKDDTKDPTKPTNADKIVGTWVVTKSAQQTPAGATIEFTKDGKLIISVTVNEASTTLTGTYKVEGARIIAAI